MRRIAVAVVALGLIAGNVGNWPAHSSGRRARRRSTQWSASRRREAVIRCRRADRARSWHLPGRTVQLELLGVVDRGPAGHRESRRHLEVLLRDVLHVLRLPPRLVHHPATARRCRESGAGLRLRLHRHPGDAAELDQQHRPERGLRHQGPCLPGDAAVQRLLGQPAPELEHRDLLQRRPRAALGQGQRRQAARACAQLVQPELGVRRGQAVGGGQPHPRQPLPGPRVRRVGDLQRHTTKIRVAVSRDRGQTFSKAVTITAPNQTGPTNEFVYPAVDAAGNVYVSIASDHPSPPTGRPSTSPLQRRRRHLVGVHAGRRRPR